MTSLRPSWLEGVFIGLREEGDRPAVQGETGTATYLLTRPVPRSALVLGKFLAYASVMVVVFLPALALTFASVVLTSPRTVDLGPGFALLFRQPNPGCGLCNPQVKRA